MGVAPSPTNAATSPLSAAPPRTSPFDQVGQIRFAEQATSPFDVGSPASLPPGTEVPRPRSKTGLIVGGIIAFGALAAVGIVALASALQSPSASSPEPLAVAQQQLEPGRVAPTQTLVAPSQPAVDAQAPSVPHGVPQAQAEPVVIQSNVPGARVFRGGVQLGTVPHTVARPAVGEETYTLTADGFQDQVVVVTPTTASPVSVTLPTAPAAAVDPRDRHGRGHPRRDRAPQTPTHPHTTQPTRTGDLHDPWS